MRHFRLLGGATLAAAFLVPAVATPTTSRPLLGVWRIPSFPGEVKFVSAGQTAYRMVVSKPWNPCPALNGFRNGQTWGRFNGAGKKLSGTATWYDNSTTCGISRTGKATLTVNADSKTATLCSVDPFGVHGRVCFSLTKKS